MGVQTMSPLAYRATLPSVRMRSNSWGLRCWKKGAFRKSCAQHGTCLRKQPSYKLYQHCHCLAGATQKTLTECTSVASLSICTCGQIVAFACVKLLKQASPKHLDAAVLLSSFLCCDRGLCRKTSRLHFLMPYGFGRAVIMNITGMFPEPPPGSTALAELLTYIRLLPNQMDSQVAMYSPGQFKSTGTGSWERGLLC